MRIIPVIDLLGGICVHAVRGERDGYQPVQSILATSAEPLAIAAGMQNVLATNSLYLADLNAIQSGQPETDTYRQLLDAGRELIIDAGLTDLVSAETCFGSFSVHEEPLTLVAGLESLCGPECLSALLARFGPDKLIFSLDLYEETPLGDTARWNYAGAGAVIDKVVALGVTKIIILDLSKIGTESGLPTLKLCKEVRAKFPKLEITLGGGIQTQKDITNAEEAGANGVLIATALHRGTIS